MKTTNILLKFNFLIALCIRASRMDQLSHANDTPRHTQRPSSLPYKAASANGKNSKVTPPRRAASSSLSRKPLSHSKTPK